MKIKAEKSNSKQTSSLLVLEGKTVKDIPKLSRLEFLDKFLANNFALSDAEDNISVEKRKYSRCTFVENTIISNMPEVLRVKFLGSDELFCFINKNSSRTLLQQLLVGLNFPLDSKDLFCWYKRKKWFLWTEAAAQAAENHGNEWGLT